MNNHDNDHGPYAKRTVIDLKKKKRPDSEESLEMLDLLRMIRSYARKTHSYGAIEGAYAIKKLADSVRLYVDRVPELQQVVNDADSTYDKLKSYTAKIYED